ncbi:hypothetical protein PI125_g22875 [Phytophthora idaei]|nr:hypothetical protein PI125_g22875 [Phytophthora idaei]
MDSAREWHYAAQMEIRGVVLKQGDFPGALRRTHHCQHSNALSISSWGVIAPEAHDRQQAWFAFTFGSWLDLM